MKINNFEKTALIYNDKKIGAFYSALDILKAARTRDGKLKI